MKHLIHLRSNEAKVGAKLCDHKKFKTHDVNLLQNATTEVEDLKKHRDVQTRF